MRPGFARLASVKAPASNPNNSASSNVSGIAAQLTSTKGPLARGPLSWIIRATSPFPVPVSPCSNKVGTERIPKRVEGDQSADLRAQSANRRRAAHQAIGGMTHRCQASAGHGVLRWRS